ncbi:NADH-quinone oxidoreductase subunit N [Leptospira levettii]|uniref:NADH-quinone oxidoreductase subunit N n=1 Tax=Leptospira levettii TaxID=2023178 RepID=UPI001EEC9288|nr:NADH-quinone oxidoreductase subunit N [Leptospira levettii]MCG6148516.1 NADH-quinone oxidoreductase subunit N [Leptospira levettii]
MSYTPSSNDLIAISPMLILCGIALLSLVVQFLIPKEEEGKPLWILSVLGILAAMYALYHITSSPGYGKFFGSQISISPLTVWLSAIYLIAGLITLLIAPPFLSQHKTLFPEFFPLLLFCLSGMMFLTSGYDLIVIFVGLEILSLSLYVMIGMARTSVAALESAMKYFLLGSFSSGFMLLGIAFLYGGSGTTNLDGALRGLFLKGYEANFSKLGLGLFLVGVSFKAALVPFHSWTPDVYEGAQTPITGFMASAGKASALGLVIIIFNHVPVGEIGNVWKILMGSIALISMTWGNIVALKQDNLKRMLAYSSISHAGYIVAGIACGASLEALYYLFSYSLLNLAAFAIISYLEQGKHEVTVNGISHLSGEHPLTALALSVIFLSFAGFPPLIGFWTKLFLLQKMAESDLFFNRVLLFGAVANSCIAFYYYMKITIQSYMKQETGTVAGVRDLPTMPTLGFLVFLLCVFFTAGWLFFQPGALL